MPRVVDFKSGYIEVRTREGNHQNMPHAHVVWGAKDVSVALVDLRVLAYSNCNLAEIGEAVAAVEWDLTALRAEWERIHGNKAYW